MVEELAVDFGSADDVNVAGEGEGCEGLEVGEDFHAGSRGHGPAEDEVSAIGQDAAKGVPGLAAHENGVAGGEAFEETEVVGHAPGHGAIASDHAVLGHGGDGVKLAGQFHTAMGALMPGWGS